MNKLKFFVNDFIVFSPRTASQSDVDISSAENSDFFQRFPAFTQLEISAFRRIAQRLKPKDPVKVHKTLAAINEHICVQTVSL